ncbi:MAG: hypothetical protein RKR03_09275 [Candidatus Competibacter sp.]|nr:hypothetical protein [Candidatus Competibacter sp.]
MKNLWRRFSDLTGRSLRTVGTCIASEFGESVIQYPGGSQVRVKGEGTAGTRYFVLDGKLDGEAPALVALEIEV